MHQPASGRNSRPSCPRRARSSRAAASWPRPSKVTTPGRCGGRMRAANAADKCSLAVSISSEGTVMKHPELTNLSTKACRLRRSTVLAATLVLGCDLASAQIGFQNSGPVIGDEVMYSIGGGSAVSMGRAAGMRSIGVGVGWNSNLICGDMSIQTTLRNQLNGITQGFQQIMSTVIQSATTAVASLPALIIQRADPGLYNLLTNGVLQARLDFDRSKLTCRAMAEKMADMAGGQLGWSQLAEGMALRQAVSSTDAVSAVEQAERRRGNGGVPWVGGGQ